MKEGTSQLIPRKYKGSQKTIISNYMPTNVMTSKKQINS